LGKHAIILNAHSYKEWATSDNSVLFEPNCKIPAYDGMFFHPNSLFNQGNIFDWKEEDFIDACERAINKVRINRLNTEGLKLAQQFTIKTTVDQILSYF
jgi:hypothetical protein